MVGNAQDGSAGNAWRAFRWIAATGMVSLGTLNNGDRSSARAVSDTTTRGVRGRIDCENAWCVAATDFAPHVDASHTEAKLDGYVESGGGFPARFDARKDKATELCIGLNASPPLDIGMKIVSSIEAAHRLQRDGARTTGELVGLFGFDLPGSANQRDWLRVGIGMEGRLACGNASLMLNATHRGEVPGWWLSAIWQMHS